MTLRSVCLVAIVNLFLTTASFSQHTYPSSYFRSPLDLRLLLSGTFGEIRTNHFHSGIDIKTNGTIGASVYAVADGYVSRIRVSAFGFGNAVYITHPNGFVSVYAHLDRFNKALSDYVKKQQYAIESFELDAFPNKNLLTIKKGDIIAKSGSSGASEGPHLHFEMRDEASGFTVNPLLFDLPVKDAVKPVISLLKVYPADENSSVNGRMIPSKFIVVAAGSNYKLAGNDTIRVSGNIAFGVQAYDRFSDTDNKNGIYSIELYKDTVLKFSQSLEKFSFDETRYVNSLIDYKEWKQNSLAIQRTKIDPNNKLDIYGYVPNHGIINFNDDVVHKMKYAVKDEQENASFLTFYVRSSKPSAPKNMQEAVYHDPAQYFRYDHNNHFENDEVIFDAPAGAFYDSFTFHYKQQAPPARCYSPLHCMEDELTPIQEYCSLAIKPHGIPGRLLEKAFVISVDKKGRAEYAGGKYEDGFVRTKIRDFGNYSVGIDTIPPVITPIQASTFKNLAVSSHVSFSIRDDLSGIKDYRGTLNGKWVLLEYDAKKGILNYDFDERLVKGKNTFKLTVTDNENNSATYETNLIR